MNPVAVSGDAHPISPLLAKERRITNPGPHWLLAEREEVRIIVGGIRPRCPSDDPVQRRVPVLADSPSFRGGRVQFRPVSKLLGAEVFGNAPNAALDILAVQINRVALTVYPTKRDVNMRVFRVVMCNRDPFERASPQFFSNAPHQLMR